MPLCGIGSALASPAVRSEKSHAGQEEEDPAEQTYYIPVADAGCDEEQSGDHEQEPSPNVVLLAFSWAVVGHINSLLGSVTVYLNL